MTALVALTATALIMGGTGHPLSTPQDSPEFINSYTTDANNDYIVLTGFCGAGSCTPTAVSTPEQFMPVSGAMPFDQSVGQGVTNLDQAINAQPAGESMVVFGYSQSARIASIQKGNLAAAGSTLPVSFVLIGNPNRPNGGILERFEGLNIPILGVTFDGATPTNTDFKTVDITRQYDGWSDFPNNPLNPFATANAIAGIHYLHGDYQSVGLGDALYQGSYGDTDYYMIPSQRPSAADAARRGGGAESDRHHPRRADARAGGGRLRPDRQPGRADPGEHHVLPGPREDRHQLHHRDPDRSRRRRPGGRKHPAVRNSRRSISAARTVSAVRPSTPVPSTPPARRWPPRRNRQRRRRTSSPLPHRNRGRRYPRNPRPPGPCGRCRRLRRLRRPQPHRRSPRRRPRWTRRLRRLQLRRSAERHRDGGSRPHWRSPVRPTSPKPAPVDMPKPAPLDMPKPVPPTCRSPCRSSCPSRRRSSCPSRLPSTCPSPSTCRRLTCRGRTSCRRSCRRRSIRPRRHRSSICRSRPTYRPRCSSHRSSLRRR